MKLPAIASAAPPAELAAAIGHPFGHPSLLNQALTHPNVLARSRASRGYQRLEWLGDRVLGLVIADLLWRHFPSEPEGDLTLRHSALVRGEALARVARSVDLGRYLVLSGSDAAAGIAASSAVLADVCEAVIAAVYLDGGFAAAEMVVTRLWSPLIDEMEGPTHSAKTRLQEWAQARGLGLPAYSLVDESGPAHARRFTVAARLADYEPAAASGSSKQQAQEQAAALLLDTLGALAPQPRRRRKR